MTKRTENGLSLAEDDITTIGRVGVWVCSQTKLKKTRSLIKLKTALFNSFALTKHYVIFSNNVL